MAWQGRMPWGIVYRIFYKKAILSHVKLYGCFGQFAVVFHPCLVYNCLVIWDVNNQEEGLL